MEPWSHKELSKKLKSFTRQNFWKFRCTKRPKHPFMIPHYFTLTVLLLLKMKVFKKNLLSIL